MARDLSCRDGAAIELDFKGVAWAQRKGFELQGGPQVLRPGIFGQTKRLAAACPGCAAVQADAVVLGLAAGGRAVLPQGIKTVMAIVPGDVGGAAQASQVVQRGGELPQPGAFRGGGVNYLARLRSMSCL